MISPLLEAPTHHLGKLYYALRLSQVYIQTVLSGFLQIPLGVISPYLSGVSLLLTPSYLSTGIQYPSGLGDMSVDLL